MASRPIAIAYPFQCPKCERKFRSSNGHRKHQENIHGTVTIEEPTRWVSGMSLTCKFCSSEFPTRRLLRTHEIAQHSTSSGFNAGGSSVEDPYPCTGCGCTFKTPHGLDRHFNTYHNSKGLDASQNKCPECDQSFATKRQLRQHKSHAHERREVDPELPFQCKSCGMRYKTPRGLQLHMSRSHPAASLPTAYQCTLCLEYFKEQKNLNFHISRAHRVRAWDRDDNSLSFTCIKCGDKYGTLHGLIYHGQHHHPDDKFHWKCGLCPEKYMSKSDLIRHTEAAHVVSDTPRFPDTDLQLGDRQYPSSTVANAQNLHHNSGGQDMEIVHRSVTSLLSSYSTGYSSSTFRTAGRQYLARESLCPAMSYIDLQKSFPDGRLSEYSNKEFIPHGVDLDEANLEGMNSQAMDYEDDISEPDNLSFGRCSIPNPDYQGPLAVSMWTKPTVDVIIHDYSVQLSTFSCIHIFEIAKELFEDVCLRWAPGIKAFYVIRYGPCVGLFKDPIPEIFITPVMIKGNDYTDTPLPRIAALNFLLSDLDVGNTNNDPIQIIIRKKFLW